MTIIRLSRYPDMGSVEIEIGSGLTDPPNRYQVDVILPDFQAEFWLLMQRQWEGFQKYLSEVFDRNNTLLSTEEMAKNLGLDPAEIAALTLRINGRDG